MQKLVYESCIVVYIFSWYLNSYATKRISERIKHYFISALLQYTCPCGLVINYDRVASYIPRNLPILYFPSFKVLEIFLL